MNSRTTVAKSALWGRGPLYTFDGTAYTSPAGRYTAIVSTTAGITITDRSGYAEGYHPLNHATAPGRLRSLTDRNGNSLTFAYDGNGRISTVTDFSGRAVILEYDAHGDLVSVTTPPSPAPPTATTSRTVRPPSSPTPPASRTSASTTT